MTIDLENISPEKTSHGVGKKFVFVKKEDVLSNLMQAAIGEIIKGDDINFHVHPTMEEYYFILEGEATFFIENEYEICKKNSFIFVPNNTKHKIITDNYIKFLFWGIAL